MARVPYSGAPSVDPTAQGTGQLQEQRIGGISAEAFGGGRRDGVGEALAGLGAQMQQSAWEWEKRQREVLRTTAAVDWINFQASNDAAIGEMENNAPANGLGHSEGVAGALTPALDKFLSAQPKWLQEEYAEPATRFFATRFNRAIEYEKGRQDQFSRIAIEKAQVGNSNRVDLNPAEADAAIADTANIIAGTSLNDTEKLARTEGSTAALRAAQLRAEARNAPYMTERGGADKLRARESSGDYTIVNNDGYAGGYQFGAPRLVDLGVYTPAAGETMENWKEIRGKAAKWRGTFNIPEFPEVRNIQDFLGNRAAQDAVYAIHERAMDATIAKRGWDSLIGTEVQGVPITREGLRYGMHLGGEGGVAAFLRGEPRQDANGTKVADYIAMGRYGEGTIADDPKYNNLTPEQRNALLADGRREFLQQRAAAEEAAKVEYGQRYNNLVKDVFDGKAGAEEIYNARQSWLTDAGDIARLEGIVSQSQKKVVDLNAAYAKYNDPTQQWTGTSEDNKMQNLMYEAAGGNEAVGRMDQQWMEQAVFGEKGFVRRTGFVPSDLISGLETNARNPDPKRRDWAYNQLARIKAELPGFLPERLRDDTATWEQRSKMLTPDQQVQAYLDDQDPDKLAGRKQRIAAAFNGKDSPMNEVDVASVVEVVTGAGGWFGR
jgi:hypothetical protein